MNAIQLPSRSRLILCLLVGAFGFVTSIVAEGNGNRLLWQIGEPDASSSEFALPPTNYTDFQERFGSPDHAYYIGISSPKEDWPCVLPGPLDRWAGSFFNERTQNHWDQMNTLPIGFVLNDVSTEGQCVFTITLCDVSPQDAPRLRVTVNSAIFERDLAAGGSEDSLRGDFTKAKPQTVQFEFPSKLLKRGYNEIALRSTRGSWLVFDALRLDAPPGINLASNLSSTVIRRVSVAPYAVSREGATPATVRVEVFRKDSSGNLTVQFDSRKVREIALEPGLQVLEIPAPVSAKGQGTQVLLRADGRLLYDGILSLDAAPPVEPADYVDVFMGTAHSRWMIAPGPWMPFGMVKISPDNQNESWCAGYEYSHDYIDCFSHIHEWTMSGLGMMPTVGPLRTHPGLDESGYSSHFDKFSEKGGIGFYEVFLRDSGIKVELTATTRASLQRYTFPASDQARVLLPFLLPNEYETHVLNANVRHTASNEMEGDIQTEVARVYNCIQRFDLHFVSQFSRPFDLGGWENLGGKEVTIQRGFIRPSGELNGWRGGRVITNAQELALSGDCGAFAQFKTVAGEQVLVRTGISLVSVEDARLNLKQELSKPFDWDFNSVVENQRGVWNNLFKCVEIGSPDAREKTRFYTHLYRAFSGRNIWSDVNGDWIDPYGREQKLGDPDAVMLGSDALWNTFWNLNPLMNLMAPEWSVRWADSELQLYDKCGWLAKGPAGLKYIDVMASEHEIALLVAAYQSCLKGLDGEKILDACVKMQTSLPQNTPEGGRVGNESLEGYLKYGYVPADGPLKGKTSDTFEYAYDDWCVVQLARSLGRKEVADTFFKRSENWRNAFDTETGFARPRKADGEWVAPFDPDARRGFTEANAWQYTWFVPQDPSGLVNAMGADRFVSRLNEAFEKMVPVRFNATANSAACPINQGNETAMHVPWLFNWAGKPWMTQKWTRAVLDSYYGYNPADAYLGDDDQGQMAAWFVMSAMGLFQTDGGCRVNPIYELGSPLYPKITIHLSNKYYGGKDFVIEAHHTSRANRYIQSATLNAQPLKQWWIRQKDIISGGHLIFELGPTPNKDWATQGKKTACSTNND
jgi:predicted alpha-1,2-mannosidase